jgi:hypothetical protein
LRDVRAIGLDSNNQAVPRSAVGFVATDTAALPEGIREISAHYAHYRKSAEAFAPQYRERHLASSTLFELTQRRVARPKAA